MKEIEKAYIRSVIRGAEHPTVNVATYVFDKTGKAIREEHHDVASAGKLLDSPEYKAGWKAAHERYAECLRWLMTDPPIKELRKGTR